MRIFFALLLICFPFVLLGQTIILSEDFNEGLQNAWYPSFPGINNITAAQNESTPGGDGWVGRLDNSNDGGVGAVLSGPSDLADFSYQANIFIPVDQATYYGIEFRLDSTGSSAGYNFICRFKPGGMVTPRIRFRYRVGATPTTIQDWIDNVPGGIPTEAAWHKMAVTCKEDSFWLYFDDQLLPGCPIIDNSASAGFIGLYYWDMAVKDTVMLVDDIVVTDKTSPTTIERPQEIIPTNSSLAQNYPNPFNPSTTIEFNLEKTEKVNLTVYNITGAAVKTLINGILPSGSQRVTWDATDNLGKPVAAGVYLYTLHKSSSSETKKMILIK
jgi:hypothetical protein